MAPSGPALAMFALPGIAALVLFIYIRPQEFIDSFAKIKFLNAFFAIAILGWIVDLRIRATRTAPTPLLGWAVAFWLWCIVVLFIRAPHFLANGALEVTLSLIAFFIISQGITTIRGFERMAVLLISMVCFLAVVGIHQGNQPTQCLEIYTHQSDVTVGTPDGRPCVLAEECYGGDAAPGAEYLCESVGLAGTHTVGQRIRYRGVLQDANELALTMSLGLALALALLVRVRTRRRFRWMIRMFVATMVCAVVIAVYMTQSRGGQLVLMAVFGVYFIYWLRWKGVAIGAALAVPLVIMLATSDRKDAASSTYERYEAWSAGFDFFSSSPFMGIGQGQFAQNHYLTAHNAYLLMAAELGWIGMTVWLTLYYLAIKVAMTALFRYRNHPDAHVVHAWALGLTAAMLAMSAGIMFLSFSYHYVLWIHIGLVGALYQIIRRHDPSFRVRLGIWEFLALIVACPLFMLTLRTFLKLKGY